MYNSLAYRPNTSSFALKTSTKGSTEGSHVRPLTEPVSAVQMTNNTAQKICYLTLDSISGTQRHTSEGVQGTLPIGALYSQPLQHMGSFKSVNHLLVALEVGLRIQRYGVFGWVGIRVDNGGGWVRCRGAQINLSKVLAARNKHSQHYLY